MPPHIKKLTKKEQLLLTDYTYAGDDTWEHASPPSAYPKVIIACVYYDNLWCIDSVCEGDSWEHTVTGLPRKGLLAAFQAYKKTVAESVALISGKWTAEHHNNNDWPKGF